MSPQLLSASGNTSTHDVDIVVSDDAGPLVKPPEGLSDAQNHMCWDDSYVEPRNRQFGFGRSDGTRTKHKSTPKVAWTRDVDEHLIHLRHMAQLK